MSNSSSEFLADCLLLDLEINENNIIYSVGAVYGEEMLRSATGQRIDSAFLRDLDTFGRSAGFVLGHNIIEHDVPRLRQVMPELEILAKPAVDTLYLSPLAFPENPYHRLVKDYQLVRDSINDPAQDALLAGKVFAEQWEQFVQQYRNNSDIPILYRSFLARDSALAGTADALAAMGIPVLEGDDLYEAFGWFAGRHGCRSTVARMVDRLHDDGISPAPLAYVCAWLSVAGGNSVLPPWVRGRFGEVPNLLHQLREVGCEDPDCDYCRSHHDPRHFLRTFWNFDDFREQPATPVGESLQKEIVSAAARNRSLFATLPTGGGKSLCYLLPALMRYQRRNMLTVVISPLQALMKDQVDNFSRQTGTTIAAAIYGMLTLPERGEVQEGVRLGDVGILYVSPEQLRNRSFVRLLQQREVGAWVFDEAHCLSKWGHDFRPDYLYAIRFIREHAVRGKSAIPPVQCFTATAKKDVQSEIIDLLQSELGLNVARFEGGHVRTNLSYEVMPVDQFGKNQVILELLRNRYQGEGSIVIYCATRKNVENLTEFLQRNGLFADGFHAGLDASVKKRVQDSFVRGETPIICATNAFGMGIDKDDVRMVIHADIPGSLENYLQEAGRAGRDRKAADCILVFREEDIEGQFRLSSLSRLTKREIAQILRGLRYAAKRAENDGEVVLTAREILRQEVVDIEPDEWGDADTRVRTAVAWLEKAGYLNRNENDTRVFQGKPCVRSLAEAEEKIARLNLSARQQKRWLGILRAMMENHSEKGFSADELASISAFAPTEADDPEETETQRVIKTLHDMAEQGILDKATMLSAYLRYKVKDSAQKKLRAICHLERDLLAILEEAAPEASVDVPLQLDLRQVNQQIIDRGHIFSLPEIVRPILYGLSRDGKGLAGRRGSVSIQSRGNNLFVLYLHRDWQSLVKTVEIRQQAAGKALQAILATVAPNERPNGDLKVEFTLEQIVEALRQDLLLISELKNPLAAAERALTFMHEHGVLILQQGLAVFRQSMTIKLNSEAQRRRYSEADFAPLGTHYSERNFQIHVMNEYARQAMEKLGAAMRLVASYFNDEKEQFVRRYFLDREKMLERATSQQSYTRIVEDLKNTAQQQIVSAEPESNILVLAGPGSGKTRVVTHRVAYLIRVQRVHPRAVLVLCFNRSAVMSLRRRLRELIGNDARRVTVLTFHGLALRLLGRSLAVTEKSTETGQIDFSAIIDDAVALLRGEKEEVELFEVDARQSVTGRFSHILVDEYQDIDGAQYELVSLLAGRLEGEEERKLSILAVGDDDQNIYRFRGANVEFIRRFRDDYRADVRYLVENYRSTQHIIAAANELIAANMDRMKTEHPIRINTAREGLPKGGNWEIEDSVGRGRVQKYRCATALEQNRAVLAEIKRLRALGAGIDYSECAVLGREWKDLDGIRSVLESAGIPVSLNWGRKAAFPRLTRIRENAVLLEHLQAIRSETTTGEELLGHLPEEPAGDTVWQANLRSLLSDWLEETGNTPQPVSQVEDYLYEALSEQGRTSNLGNGVFLSTVHSVKGLEFDHVFILGDSWKKTSGEEQEEERRLYYVAMSRARMSLHLFDGGRKAHPHLELLEGRYAAERACMQGADPDHAPRRYTLLGLDDLYMDYAGGKRKEHPVHEALGKLEPGKRLHMVLKNERIELCNDAMVVVARLSRQAWEQWQGRVDSVKECRVIAVGRRYKNDVKDETFRCRCRVESWEVPIVEIVV